MKWLRVTILLVTTMTACSLSRSSSDITRQPFGSLTSGESITSFTLTNSQGTRVALSSLGATIVGIEVADRDGNFSDVVLGYPSGEDYQRDPSFFGVTVGRYANRIRKASFSIDGTNYRLDQNEGENHLHGGQGGFHSKNWQAEILESSEATSVRFTLISPDGDQGFPGTVAAAVTYSLRGDNALHIEYRATTDKPTVINLTNHAYFNLAGAGSGDILSHVLELNADAYTATDNELIPTGAILPVAGTYLDFTTPTPVGAHKNLWPQRLPGYDHNVVVRGTYGQLRRAAHLYEPKSGRSLEVFSTAPGLQVYSGIHLNGIAGKDDLTYEQYGGICLEAQNFPDAPNRPEFPSPVLRPGEEYRATIVYRFASH